MKESKVEERLMKDILKLTWFEKEEFSNIINKTFKFIF